MEEGGGAEVGSRGKKREEPPNEMRKSSVTSPTAARFKQRTELTLTEDTQVVSVSSVFVFLFYFP